jgi:hypothetical protein
LSVIGTASLGGKLTAFEVGIGGGSFTPMVGQTFDVLTATAGVSGAFATNSGQWVAKGTLVKFSTIYGANKVTLQVTSLSTLIPGDFTGDGSVDAADYTIWRDTLGSHNLAADGNGVIDSGD